MRKARKTHVLPTELGLEKKTPPSQSPCYPPTPSIPLSEHTASITKRNYLFLVVLQKLQRPSGHIPVVVGSMPLLARNLGRCAHSKPNATGAQEGSGRAGILAEIEVNLCAVLVAVVRGLHGAGGVAVGGTEVVDLCRDISATFSRWTGRDMDEAREGGRREGKVGGM